MRPHIFMQFMENMTSLLKLKQVLLMVVFPGVHYSCFGVVGTV